MVATINRIALRGESTAALRCRRKFLRIFSGGFRDPEYIELERDYKWQAHLRWLAALNQEHFEALLRKGRHPEIAAGAIVVESRTNLLFSFEKIVTVFGFIAQPLKHIFLKPRVTQVAAKGYGYELKYFSKPSWATYASLLGFAANVQRLTRDLRPRDYIDVQSFIWVIGSEEYED